MKVSRGRSGTTDLNQKKNKKHLTAGEFTTDDDKLPIKELDELDNN